MKNKLFVSAFIFSLCFISPLIAAQEEKNAQADQSKISLDIKGMDVVDVLKMLAGRTGMNLVIGKNVTGKVTLFLKNVDVQDAFEIVILANDLAYEKKGVIINIMTQRDYELLYGERYQDKKEAKIIQLKYAKAADLSRAINLIKTSIGKIVVDEGSNTIALIDTPQKIKEMEDFIKRADLPVETRIFNLNYAQADKLMAKIQESITKGVGSIKIDERTNKIAITDYPEKLDAIASIINAFDEKTFQVLIDAQVIEIKPSDTFQMGVDWDNWIKKNVRLAAALPTAGAVSKFSFGEAAESGGNTGLAIATLSDYKIIIDLLRTIGDVNILSSPRITALNNQEAKILVGKKDAYITSTVSQSGTGGNVTAQEVNFVDSGVKLYVTPTVNRDGFVTMKIKPEISEATLTPILSEGQNTTVPIVTTSEAETTVTIKDGVTLIIGGLRQDKKTKTVTKIPGLGDIPFLGALFRRTSDVRSKTELVILLTPHIISGETSFSDFSEIKPVEGARVDMVNGEIVTTKVSSSRQEKALSSLGSRKEDNLNYYQLITNRIRDIARINSPVDKKGQVDVSFTLSITGNLIDEPEVAKTTDSTLGPYAIKAVKEASPFPPFPKELDKTQARFKISLVYGIEELESVDK